MNKYLNITIWNSNGLTQHAEEIKTFILTNNIDIMLISETHATNRSYFKMNKYTTYLTNHPDGTAHGGTGIIIKNSIKHHESHKYIKDYLQATILIIEDWLRPLTIAAIYCPPRHSIKSEKFSEFFNTLGNRFLAGGDYNSKHSFWGSRLINPKGRQLYLTLQKNKLDYLSTGEPTYWPTDPNKLPDLVDFCIVKGIPTNQCRATSSLDLSSDHSPVIISVSTTIQQTSNPPTLCNRHTNWNRFREIIQNNLDIMVPLKTPSDIAEN